MKKKSPVRFLFLFLVCASLFSVGASRTEILGPLEQTLRDTIQMLQIPAPITEQEYAQLSRKFEAPLSSLGNGQVLDLSMTFLDTEGTQPGINGFSFVSGKAMVQDAALGTYQSCRLTGVVSILDVNSETAKTNLDLVQMAEQGFEKMLAEQGLTSEAAAALEALDLPVRIDEVEYHGSTIQVGSFPVFAEEDASSGRREMAIWRDGDWVFQVALRTHYEGVAPVSTSNFSQRVYYRECPLSFDPGPELDAWYIALHDAAVKNGLIRGGQLPPAIAMPGQVPAVEYPTRADCRLGFVNNPDYPLLFSVHLLDGDKNIEDYTIRMDWKRNAPTMKELSYFNPIGDNHFPEMKTDNAWYAYDGVTRFGLRVNIKYLPVNITEKTPLVLPVDIYGPASADDLMHSRLLARCTLSIPYIGVAYDLRGTVERLKGRDWSTFKQGDPILWETVTEGFPLYTGDNLNLYPGAGVNVAYVDGQRTYTNNFYGKSPTIFYIAHPSSVNREKEIVEYFLGQAGEEGAEALFSTVNKTVGGFASAYFLVGDFLEIVTQGEQAMICLFSEPRVSPVVMSLPDNKFVMFEDEVAEVQPFRGNCTALDLRSQVSAALEPEGWRLRTLEGEPLVYTSEGAENALVFGMEMIPASDGSFQGMALFDVSMLDIWWEEGEPILPELVNVEDVLPLPGVSTEEPTGLAEGEVPSIPDIEPSWMLLAGGVCLGIVVLLVAGLLIWLWSRSSRKAQEVVSESPYAAVPPHITQWEPVPDQQVIVPTANKENRRTCTCLIILLGAGVALVLLIMGAGVLWMRRTNLSPLDAMSQIVSADPPLQEEGTDFLMPTAVFEPINPTQPLPMSAPTFSLELQPIEEATMPSTVDTQASAGTELSMSGFASCLQPCAADGSNQQDSFPEKTTQVYFRHTYENIPAGAEVTRRWSREGWLWVVYHCTWDQGTSGVFETSLREPAGLASGLWEYEVVINNHLVLQELIFIEGNYEYWIPAGFFEGQCK